VLIDLRRFAEIDSTNTWLLAEARHGGPEGLAAVADHQFAGRGRLDRRFEAEPGAALLASFLLRPVLDPSFLHLTVTLVALSAVCACEQAAGLSPDIKWPNDLVVGDRKLAGVLSEADPGAPGGPDGSVAVVVGIGLNIVSPGPDADAWGATSLADAHAAGHATAVPTRDELLAALVAELERRRPDLDTDRGRRGLADELRRRCTTLGRPVRVELPGRVLEGLAVDVSDEGLLVIETDTGTERVAVGDVVHLRAAGQS
jgi:BirA family transcriptional regulator, biotin operon repressor / biotin---[acetyl-CoA-carboxylase] ligase